MKIIKKITAVLLAILMLASLTACHQAGEVVATLDDKYEITSGVYLAMFINADIEARNTIYDALEEAGSSTTDVNYHKQKIGDKSFADWVSDRARELAKQYMYVEKTFDDMGLELTDDDTATINKQVNYYWSYYGYSTLYEDNGVSLDSYTTYYVNQYKMNKILTTLYSEGGDKALTADQLKEGLTDNFQIANVLTGSLTDDDGEKLSDEAKAKLKEKFEGYAKRLKNGEGFDKIYVEYNGSDIKDADADETDSDSAKPQDKYSTLFASEAAGDTSGRLEKIKKLKTGEISVLEFDDCYMLAVKKDIIADPYYAETYHDSTISILKADEFEKDVEEASEKLEVTFNNFGVNRFSVKKINYPSAV